MNTVFFHLLMTKTFSSSQSMFLTMFCVFVSIYVMILGIGILLL